MASRLCSPFLSPSLLLFVLLPAFLLLYLPGTVKGDCWLIEGDKGYVWLAICSQNQPPYETIPQHINSTVSVSLSGFSQSCFLIHSWPNLLLFLPSCILTYDSVISKSSEYLSLSLLTSFTDICLNNDHIKMCNYETFGYIFSDLVKFTPEVTEHM